MMTGGTPRAFCAGIWNWTYIWPIMIWFGVSVWFGLFGAGSVAYSVTLGTPPMKKLPWSSITSGLVRNFFILAASSAMAFPASANSRIAGNRRKSGLCVIISTILIPLGATHMTVDVDVRGLRWKARIGGLPAPAFLERIRNQVRVDRQPIHVRIGVLTGTCGHADE